MLNHPIFQPRNVYLISLLVSIGALGAALVAQFAFDLKPCILCLYARIPYAILILVCIAALLRHNKASQTEQLVFMVLVWLGFVASFAIAFFHVGVEQHWWQLTGGCPVEKLGDKTAEQALAELLSTPLAACDKVAWELFGLSIVIWNALLALVMNDYVLLALVAMKKKKHA